MRLDSPNHEDAPLPSLLWRWRPAIPASCNFPPRSSQRGNMPLVLVELPDGRGLRPAEEILSDEHTNVPNDLHYIIAIAHTAAGLVEEVDRFIISYTQTVDTVLTPRDVWLLIAEEEAISLPQPPVCHFFCTHGYSCRVPWRGFPRDIPLAASEVALRVRNLGRAVRANWPHILAPRGHPAPGWLPLGPPAFRTEPVGVPPIEQRPVDVCFRGSLGGGRPYGPKVLTRRRMASAIGQLRSDLVVDFVDTGTFEASYSLDPASYAQSLLNAKICLAPRGGSLETWRVFEAAVAGCVVVTDPKPASWFYTGLPRKELHSWSQLPDVVDELFDHPELMKAMSDAGRDWAVNVVSPTAVGHWVARRVQHQQRGITAGPTASRSETEDGLGRGSADAGRQPSQHL